MSRAVPPTEREKFARRLRLAREQKYQYANQLAEIIGEEHETYRRWERGETEPNIAALCKIARHLNVSLDYLLAGEPPKLTG